LSHLVYSELELVDGLFVAGRILRAYLCIVTVSNPRMNESHVLTIFQNSSLKFSKDIFPFDVIIGIPRLQSIRVLFGFVDGGQSFL